MKNLILILTISTLIFSCSNTKEKNEKSLIDQVMKVHDEVMPKMGAMMKTKKALVEKANSLTDTLAATELSALADEIELANEAMMDWMRNFDPKFSGTEDEVKDYLMKKKNGIEKVAEQMNKSLEKGQKALE